MFRGGVVLVAAAVLTGMLALPALARSRAQGGTPSSSPCPMNCTPGGFCNTPGATVPPPYWVTDFAHVWRLNNGLWCLFAIDVCIQDDRKHLCSGSIVTLQQIIAYRERLVACFNSPAELPPNGGGPLCINRPSTPGGVPTTPPLIVSTFYNCFGAATGQGPGTPAPAPQPVPTPPPAPGAGPPTVTTGGDGFWLETPTSITRSRCWVAQPCESCEQPLAAGTVVIQFRAKKAANGGAEPGSEKAEHAATANGDGSYTSKNGNLPLNTNASESEAFGGYSIPSKGDVVTRVCYVRVPDCQE